MSHPSITYALVAYYALCVPLTVLMIGRRRDPLTPGGAVVAIIFYALLIWAVLTVASR